MVRAKATFIGIGAQKCASTWLDGVLRQMPQVRLGAEKEIDFFSARFDRGFEWYERTFSGTPDVVHRGEISPSYFVDGDAPSRARRYDPSLCILVTLRDPVARAFSNHLHEVRKGHVSGSNLRFEAAMENNPLYREQGRYGTHLARWLDHFPADRVKVFFQEEIHTDPHGCAAEVATFLDLPPIASFVARHENESVAYRNPVIGTSLWRMGQFARRHRLGAAVEAVKAAPIVSDLRAANRRPVRDTVPDMEHSTVEALKAFYEPEVERLAALLGRDPPWPRFARPTGLGTAIS